MRTALERSPQPTCQKRARGKSHRTIRRDPLLISRLDRSRLLRLLGALQANEFDAQRVDDLRFEVERATPVAPNALPSDVVTMNAWFRFTDLTSAVVRECAIVFPKEANDSEGRISVLDPVGIALLGYRAGDVVSVNAPGGERRLRIDVVTYQPEAAGDYEL
ncbi:MAG: GreA/GreB family elongation factor [Thermoanaerobaculia bacterium]|nr:GreA/GreB family elongation factor [Thermoanaerobaculia bacterium]